MSIYLLTYACDYAIMHVSYRKGETDMISYKPLKHTLVDQGLTWRELRERCEPPLGISTTDRISRGDLISLQVIDRICTALSVPIQNVIEHVPDDLAEKDSENESEPYQTAAESQSNNGRTEGNS